MKGFLKFTSKTKKDKLGGSSTIDPLNMELLACSSTFNCITSQSWHVSIHTTVWLKQCTLCPWISRLRFQSYSLICYPGIQSSFKFFSTCPFLFRGNERQLLHCFQETRSFSMTCAPSYAGLKWGMRDYFFLMPIEGFGYWADVWQGSPQGGKTPGQVVTELWISAGPQTLAQLTPLWKGHSGCKIQHVNSITSQN